MATKSSVGARLQWKSMVSSCFFVTGSSVDVTGYLLDPGMPSTKSMVVAVASCDPHDNNGSR